MPTFFTVLNRVLAALPFAVHTIELTHGDQSGATKKQKVLSIISDGLSAAAVAAPEIAPAISAATPAIGDAVDAVVKVLNCFGALKSPAAATATAVGAASSAASTA